MMNNLSHVAREAILTLGGNKLAAEKIGVSEVAMWKWQQGGIPPKRVLQIEELTGIPRWRLRPDLFARPE